MKYIKTLLPLLSVLLMNIAIMILSSLGERLELDKELVRFIIACSAIFGILSALLSVLLILCIEEPYLEEMMKLQIEKSKTDE